MSIALTTSAQRAELEALLGREYRGARATIDLSALDEVLAAGPLGASLPAWLGQLGSPLRDRPREGAERTARLTDAAARLATCQHAPAEWYERWKGQIEERGTLARLDSQGTLGVVDAAVRVLDRLPSPGITRPQLAAEVTGDPKALDGGALAGLVLSALASWAGQDPESDAASIHALWERFDVYGDDLASQVLVLGLRPTGEDPFSAWLRAAADVGHPLVLTRRDVAQALRFEPAEVFGCENPSVVHAAARLLGGRCPPLLCANGRPHAAFWRLGEMLTGAGCRLWYHGDLDPIGVDIARAVQLTRLGARWKRAGGHDHPRART